MRRATAEATFCGMLSIRDRKVIFLSFYKYILFIIFFFHIVITSKVRSERAPRNLILLEMSLLAAGQLAQVILRESLNDFFADRDLPAALAERPGPLCRPPAPAAPQPQTRGSRPRTEPAVPYSHRGDCPRAQNGSAWVGVFSEREG